VETAARVEKSDALPPHPTSSWSLAHLYVRFLATALIFRGFMDVNVEVSSSGNLPAYPQVASHSMQPAPPLSDFANVSVMLVRDMTASLMPYTRICSLSSPSPEQQASYLFVDNPNILLVRTLSANPSQLGCRKDPYEDYLKKSLSVILLLEFLQISSRTTLSRGLEDRWRREVDRRWITSSSMTTRLPHPEKGMVTPKHV
jgi:hypothetical protein